MTLAHNIAVAYGDSPTATEAALLVLARAYANLNFTALELGGLWYGRGAEDGIPPHALNSISNCSALLMGAYEVPAEMLSPIATLREKYNLWAEEAHVWQNLAITIYRGADFAIFTPRNSAPENLIFASIALLKHLNESETALQIEKALQSVYKASMNELNIELSIEDFANLITAKLWE